MNTLINKLIILCLFTSASLPGNSQIINTIAGNGTGGFNGDLGNATAAEMYTPTDIALDAAGNIYIADAGNNRIRKVDAAGIITTFAGGGGSLGDGGPATSAQFFYPRGLAIDASGNVYVADYFDNRIRIINKAGIINTFAGNGAGSPFSGGFSGDGAAATSASLFGPEGVALDTHGNVYIADRVNNRIRMVNASGIINTIAGGGSNGLGDGGLATAAQLAWPTGIAIDAAGNVYIADQLHNRVRMVNISGIINTIAGIGFGSPWSGAYSGDGGAATSAELYWPTSIAVDSAGNIFIADSGNNCTRKINTLGIISTVAGDGASGYFGDGGLATSAELRGTEGVALDPSGNIYLTDVVNNRVREVTFSNAGIGELPNTSQKTTAYPVPTSGLFTISGIIKGQLIELYNYEGEKISDATADNSTMNFDISTSANGIYFIRILNNDGNIASMQKILKTQ